MPRSASTNRDIRDSRRADILRAAAKLFARRGLTDTKIGDIAREAGLSHGLVYHYFPSKEAVFEAVITEKREAAWEDVAACEAEHGVEAAMHLLLQRTLDDARERPEVTVMITQALLTDCVPDKLRASLRRGARESFNRTTSFFERGQAAGCVDASVPATQLAAAMFCLVRGIFLANAQALRGHGWMPLPEADTILRLLLPRGRTSAPLAVRASATTEPVEASRATTPSEPATRKRTPRALKTKKTTTSRARVRAGGVE
jgi:AcrR family transcriptional regulator